MRGGGGEVERLLTAAGDKGAVIGGDGGYGDNAMGGCDATPGTARRRGSHGSAVVADAAGSRATGNGDGGSVALCRWRWRTWRRHRAGCWLRGSGG